MTPRNQWQERTIKSFADFQKTISELSAHWPNRNKWLFRGQKDEGWSLKSSLLRLLDRRSLTNKHVVELERQMRHAFRGEAHRFIPSHYLAEFESDLTHWWALMRHFGSPTRILDWTLSPYVALYFAVEGCWDKPGALWCVRGKAIGKAFGEKNPKGYKNTWKEERKRAKGNPFMQSDPTPILYVYEMEHQIDRIAAQQGQFLVCTDALEDHADTLARNLDSADLLKFSIAPVMKPDFMRELHLMNITAKSLFPGTEGLGRSMEEIARLSIEFDKPNALAADTIAPPSSAVSSRS
jgi:hypothetical protein